LAPEPPQPVVLAFDSAGSGCSAVVVRGDALLAIEHIAGLHGQAEALMPMIDTAMCKAGTGPVQLDCVATTVGPGSFTGIRIGLAAARGIALATGARLIGVSSFEAVAAVGLPQGEPACYLLVALESRREDLFIQLFEPSLNPTLQPAAVLPAALSDTVHSAIGSAPLLIAGDAAGRAALLLADRPDTACLESSALVAVGVARAALSSLRLGGPGAPARPLYLRAPGVTVPQGRA
jgi:tRNA threonylcarbamoyladenosine biosynthesis protein TsaB